MAYTSYGEHIEEHYALMREDTPKNKIKAEDIADCVLDTLVAQGHITLEESNDPEYITQLIENVKYYCNL